MIAVWMSLNRLQLNADKDTLWSTSTRQHSRVHSFISRVLSWSPYCSASWLCRHQPCGSTIKLHWQAHVDNMIHCLLLTTAAEVWRGKSPFVQKGRRGPCPTRKRFRSVHVWRGSQVSTSMVAFKMLIGHRGRQPVLFSPHSDVDRRCVFPRCNS